MSNLDDKACTTIYADCSGIIGECGGCSVDSAGKTSCSDCGDKEPSKEGTACVSKYFCVRHCNIAVFPIICTVQLQNMDGHDMLAYC